MPNLPPSNNENFAVSSKDHSVWDWENRRNDETPSEFSLGSLSSLLRGEGVFIPSEYPTDVHVEDDTSALASKLGLQDVLKQILSEGVKEGELGSSSGLEFAKLTQSKLETTVATSEHDSHALDDAGQSVLHSLNFDTQFDLLNPASFDTVTDSVLNAAPLPEGLQLESIPTNGSANSDVLHLDVPQTDHLVDLYFAHSHIIYPIINEHDFMDSLETFRSTPESDVYQSPLCVFRLWMVLAIGSTAYCSVDTSAAHDFTGYYNRALKYSDSAADIDSMVSSTRTFGVVVRKLT